ncbi:WD40 repeat-like protein [Cylindrobasidium torrendii FP15055 ss-10]|uniref:WD40 repeat-like protein n=1 Tax=Cylindrobasidium torrendii FP15055 ss-10 TaxID=1314674 RepID=A0A0D7B8W0_9AGAR|nr:WD40 repeat-like protein [Cylindrobasidium torrendii FP15055 ss-10]
MLESTEPPSTPPRRPSQQSGPYSRSGSPTPSISEYSLIGEDEASTSDSDYAYWGTNRSPYRNIGLFGRRAIHSTPVLSSYFSAPSTVASTFATPPGPPSPFRGFLPRIWDVLTTPSRESLTSPSRGYMTTPSRPSPSRYLSFGSNKGKRRACYEQDFFQDPIRDSSISYADLPPLDDDEGELIDVDDEACFVAVDYPWGALGASRARFVTGIDIVSLLPPEVSLQILYALVERQFTRTSNAQLQQNMHAHLACLSVSKTWRRLANDNSVWRASYNARWGPLAAGQDALDYSSLFRQRYELDRRWTGTWWQPSQSQLSGHRDSVYCIESCRSSSGPQYVITGSRDRTMKFWNLDTGKCLGTFGSGVVGGELEGHRGSVLCIKFVWEVEGEKGLVFSGSSDSTVCIWDLWLVKNAEGDVELRTKVHAVLKGHGGGVLDLEVVDDWIITCSKDGVIRIWQRDSLEIHQTLRGHDGPVNAVCAEGGRLVSASGDGKLILWDIVTGHRIRTLEGHDRGLACIEFKDGLIISGSNDCKIKVWSAATGECLNTFTGHTALVRALSYDPATSRLASASYDKSIRLWDVSTGKLLRELKHHHTSHIFDVKFDALRLLSASHDQRVIILDFSAGLDDAQLFV